MFLAGYEANQEIDTMLLGYRGALNSFSTDPMFMIRCMHHKKKNSQKITLLPFSSKFGTREAKRFTQSLSKFERTHLNSAYMMNLFGLWSHVGGNVKMASDPKRPRSSNFSREEVLEMLLEEDEDHLGMSSDEESEIDRELGYQSGLLR